MPISDLVRLYIRHVAIGYVLAALFIALLLWLDVGGLWHLVAHTAEAPLAVALLVLFNGIVFSGVRFGIAVMGMAAPEGGGNSGRKAGGDAGRPVAALVPIDRR